MKNHKINYKKYITLVTVLAMTFVGVATVSDNLNNTKYEVADTTKVVEQVVTTPEEVVEDVNKVEATPSEPAPNVKAQAAVAVEKENPFENEEFLDFFEDLNPESIVETGEATTLKGEEVYYAWSIYYVGKTDDGNYGKGTDVDLHIIPKKSFEKVEDLFKYLDFGSSFKLTNTELDADDAITLAYPEERLNNFGLPTDLLDKYYLPATNSTGNIKVNKDHNVTFSQITSSGITVSLPDTSSSFISFFEKQTDGEWREINANSHATAYVDTKQYKEDFDLEKDLDFKAIIYLNTNALIGESGWEDFPASWKGSPEETIPTTLADYNNLKGTVIDLTDSIEITDVVGRDEKPINYSYGETATLSVKKPLGYDFEALKGTTQVNGISGNERLFVEVGYLAPKSETPEPETGVSTPELNAEPIKLPLENRDFKGLEELIYEAHDSKDGNLNSKVKIKSGAVNLSKVGKYTLVLEVTNSDGVTAEEQVVIEVFENEIEPKPETPVIPEDTETEIEEPKGPEPEQETPEVPDVEEPEKETSTPEVPETPDVEEPTETTPDVVSEPEQTKVVEKVEVTNDPKTETVKVKEPTKEQAKQEPLEAEKEEVTATPKVDKKAGPDKLLQTDIKPLNPALSLIGGIALVAVGLYFFKKSYLVFKTSITNLKNSKK